MTISLGSRTYKVEKVEQHDAFKNGYLLTGARGAQYGLIRYNKTPEFMFAIQLGGRHPKVSPVLSHWIFTDKDGDLKSVSR